MMLTQLNHFKVVCENLANVMLLDQIGIIIVSSVVSWGNDAQSNAVLHACCKVP